MLPLVRPINDPNMTVNIALLISIEEYEKAKDPNGKSLQNIKDAEDDVNYMRE